MKTKHYQERLANAIKKGVMKYYVARGYGSTKVAQARKHQVRRGETLSAIARRYQVSTQTLRRANRLSDDNILTGSVLLIPN